MSGGIDYIEQNGVRHNILDIFKYSKYFLDVQEKREKALSVLVSKPYDAEYVKKVIENQGSQNPSYEINIACLVRLNQCFAWFDDAVTSASTPEFQATYQAAEQKIKENLHHTEKLYKDIKFMERGKTRSILEFAHFRGGTVHLYKIAASKRKDRRKKKSLESAVDHLEKHFWKDLRHAKGYIIRPSPNNIDLDLVFDRECHRQRR